MSCYNVEHMVKKLAGKAAGAAGKAAKEAAKSVSRQVVDEATRPVKDAAKERLSGMAENLKAKADKKVQTIMKDQAKKSLKKKFQKQ